MALKKFYVRTHAHDLSPLILETDRAACYGSLEPLCWSVPLVSSLLIAGILSHSQWENAVSELQFWLWSSCKRMFCGHPTESTIKHQSGIHNTNSETFLMSSVKSIENKRNLHFWMLAIKKPCYALMPLAAFSFMITAIKWIRIFLS